MDWTRAVAQLWIVRICGRFAIGYNKSLSALGWVGGFCVTLLFFSFPVSYFLFSFFSAMFLA